MEPVAGKKFDLAGLERIRGATGKRYLEFLRSASMSAGLYTVEAGSEDPQSPHAEDEVYYVAAGRGRFHLGERDHAVGPGTVLFVPAGMPHRFHDVRETLKLLVVFAPPEGGAKASAP